MPASEYGVAMRGLVVATMIAVALPASGAGKVAKFECAGAVCGFNVPARDVHEAPCERQPVLVVYSQSSGATLIQCSGPDGNMSYLFDRGATGRAGLELAGTRFIKSDFLAEAAESGVPDRFGPVPLCVKPELAAAGEFVLIAKTPAPDSASAYCYRVIRVGAQGGALALQADAGEPPAAAPMAHKKWRKLASKVLMHIPAGHPR